jgi:hypothetical protein
MLILVGKFAVSVTLAGGVFEQYKEEEAVMLVGASL